MSMACQKVFFQLLNRLQKLMFPRGWHNWYFFFYCIASLISFYGIDGFANFKPSLKSKCWDWRWTGLFPPFHWGWTVAVRKRCSPILQHKTYSVWNDQQQNSLMLENILWDCHHHLIPCGQSPIVENRHQSHVPELESFLFLTHNNSSFLSTKHAAHRTVKFWWCDAKKFMWLVWHNLAVSKNVTLKEPKKFVSEFNSWLTALVSWYAYQGSHHQDWSLKLSGVWVFLTTFCI